jgi:hypothetical protein
MTMLKKQNTGKHMQRLFVLAALSLLSACTTEQAYYVGQQFQGSQCSQLPDKHDYDACMNRNRGSYDSYRKERDQQ